MKKVALLLVVLGFLMSALNYASLPEMLPTHWNIRGEVDSYMPKEVAAWLLPGLTLVFLGLFAWLPKMDPKYKKYKLFAPEWEIIQTGIIGFFAYIHGVTIYISLNPGTEILPWMFAGLGTLFVLLGNYMGKIRQNYFLGIKLPWTLNSEENWNKTHRYASWWFVGAGLVTVVAGLLPLISPVMVFGVMMLAVVMPMVYSYLLFRGQEGRMKWVYVVVLGLMLGILFLRTAAGEDDWICQEGELVSHGQPREARPVGPCE